MVLHGDAGPNGLEPLHMVLAVYSGGQASTYRQPLQNRLDALQAICDWFLEAFEAVIVLQNRLQACVTLSKICCLARRYAQHDPVQ